MGNVTLTSRRPDTRPRGPSRPARVALAAVVALIVAHGPATATQETRGPRAENVRVEHEGFGVVRVFFDLISETPGTPEQVTLQVARDEGEPFNMVATSVSGDVGAGVLPGAGKQIIWEAGRDVERVNTDRFRFRVVIGTGIRLVVVTSPAGAQVYINGTMRGDTPLNLGDLPAGEHQVRIIKEGYLENSQVVMLEPGTNETMEMTLTAADTTRPVVESGGGSRLPLILAIVGGGAAAAVFIAAKSGGDSDPPPPPPPSCTPGTRNFSGTLTRLDGFSSIRTRSRADTFQQVLTANVGQRVTIRMASDEFDTYLILLNPNGQVVAEDDDSGAALNSEISSFAPTVSGAYTIEATAFASGESEPRPGLGSYTLSASIECIPVG